MITSPRPASAPTQISPSLTNQTVLSSKSRTSWKKPSPGAQGPDQWDRSRVARLCGDLGNSGGRGEMWHKAGAVVRSGRGRHRAGHIHRSPLSPSPCMRLSATPAMFTLAVRHLFGPDNGAKNAALLTD